MAMNSSKPKYTYEIPIIELDQFSMDKLIFDYYKTTNPCYMINTIYQYTPQLKDILIMKTPFMDITPEFIKANRKLWNRNFPDKKLLLDPAQFSSNMIDLFMAYDAKVKAFVQNEFGNNIKCISKLIGNNNKQRLTNEYHEVNLLDGLHIIPGKIRPSKKLAEYSKLINYNISKKYPKHEEFDFSAMSTSMLEATFQRIMSQKKQIRLLFSPTAWVDDKGFKYGSYLRIIMIEVKYENATIRSMLDMREKLIDNIVSEIII